jgi:excisionase family DNA binding protein
LNVAISPSASDSSEDEPRWLTATEAADLLGVSYNTIVNWENAGRLHAHKQRRLLTNGQHREIRVFKEAEVRKFLRRRDPNEEDEVAARAFEMFEAGRQIREIVIALRVRPERIERLHDQWKDFGGAELVVTPVAKRELERIIGPFVGVADIVERVAELAKKLASQSQQP